MSKVQCVKVSELRKNGYDSFEEWLKDPNNVYTGRPGRIFINKVYFRYDGSKWQNPYTLKKYPDVHENLKMYKEHIIKSGLINDIEELKGKTLGCFCVKHEDSLNNPLCHAQVLYNFLNNPL